MLEIDKHVDTVNNVLHFLRNHREEALRALFGEYETPDYYREYVGTWRILDEMAFWVRLDSCKRRMLVQAAKRFYKKSTLQA